MDPSDNQLRFVPLHVYFNHRFRASQAEPSDQSHAGDCEFEATSFEASQSPPGTVTQLIILVTILGGRLYRADGILLI